MKTVITETTSHDITDVTYDRRKLDNGVQVLYIYITNKEGQTVKHTIFTDHTIVIKKDK